ncbi:MAG TPA: site-specific DNA-methyltransferase [Planctomycetota bacterium]|nr:site-specific DNA-methyltransferase [Planctomycetota bacterium]
MIKTRETRAPRNRTLFLEPGDESRFVPDSVPAHPAEGVFVGDAADFLSRLDPGAAGLVFADPPYNKGKHFGNNRDRRADYESWTATWLDLAKRALAPDGSIYVCSTWERSGLMQRLLEERFVLRNRITWRRDKGRGARANWKNNHEDVWFATAGDRYTFNLDTVKVKKQVIAPYRDAEGRPKDWSESPEGRHRMTHPSNIWTDLCVPFWSMPENTPHPTQKPERLVERIVQASSRPGDLVIDPFLGSGTTAVVAKRLGRRFAGVDLNPDYVRLALKRLART